MAEERYKYLPIETSKDDLNFRDLLDKYLRYWPWFIITSIIGLLLAVGYIKYSIPTYKTVASIIIKDDEGKTSSSSSGIAGFSDLGLLGGGGTNSIENELGLIKSKRMMTNTIKALNLRVQYLKKENFRTIEIYDNGPYIVNLIQLNEEKLAKAKINRNNSLTINSLNNDNIELVSLGDEKRIKTRFGSIVKLDFADFYIEKNQNYSIPKESNSAAIFQIKFETIDNISSIYRSRLKVDLIEENSTLIQLSLIDPVNKKAENIIDQLISEYNKEAIDDKNLIAQNTAIFIDERLKIINKELDSVETGKEEFKEVNRLTDIATESSLNLHNVSEYNSRQQDVSTQLEMTNSMITYLRSDKLDLFPTNIGIEDAGLNELVVAYNKTVLERDKLLAGSTAKNPIVINLENQIRQLKSNLRKSMESKQANLSIIKNNLRRQAGIIGSQISEAPSQERMFRGIERQQNIKESLYLFLLEKREENSLSLAAKAPKAKIVDQAYSLKIPMSPNPKIILSVALLLGLMIPFLLINIKNLLNNKILNRKDIEKITKVIPIAGELPKLIKENEDIIKVNDRSILSESFSILYTNLQYLLVKITAEKQGRCIYVTSTIKGEGKTFTAVNLALTAAITGKKVLVIGADIRNPQLHRYEPKIKNVDGLSNYLINNNLNLNSVIYDSELHANLKLLPSGTIPPNPTELLSTEKVGEMFSKLRTMFDYVIVDTPPAMLIADTFLISQYADLTLYMVRSGYTEKKLLDFTIDAEKDGKLKKTSFVLNDVKLANFGYGNKYGYTYGIAKQSFWSKLRGRR